MSKHAFSKPASVALSALSLVKVGLAIREIARRPDVRRFARAAAGFVCDVMGVPDRR